LEIKNNRCLLQQRLFKIVIFSYSKNLAVKINQLINKTFVI